MKSFKYETFHITLIFYNNYGKTIDKRDKEKMKDCPVHVRW